MSDKNLIVGSDHAGFDLKLELIALAKELGYQVQRRRHEQQRLHRLHRLRA